MKQTEITWRVSFIKGPTEVQLAKLTKVLSPIASFGSAPDYDLVWREFGLADYIFVEQSESRDPAELALHCLTRAHLLGTGWRIMWPSISRKNAATWSSEEFSFAALPESMKGFGGGINADSGKLFLEDVHAIGFQIRVQE